MIEAPSKVVGIDSKDQRHCYSCSRTAPKSSMTICLNCGSHMCMQDDDCKAFCLCDVMGEKVVIAS